MSRRAAVFALVLLISAALVTYGVVLVSPPWAFVVAGMELAAWAWLVLGE